MEKILLAGGNGFIGNYLSQFLEANNFDVYLLTRNKGYSGNKKTYFWDPYKGELDINALNDLSHIIQLSGANISAKRWTKSRKKEIIESRVKSTDFLFNEIKKNGIKLKSFISASAIGYYGALSSENTFTESDLSGNDFLAVTCKLWEQSSDQFSIIGVRTVKIRTGIVLGKKGGALKQLILISNLGLASALGSGKQYMPWIHIEDLCGIYLKAINDTKMIGAYNAVAPFHATNKEFTSELAKVLNKPIWLPQVPEFLLRIVFGELSEMLLNGSRISSEKISQAGYIFKFNTLKAALTEIIPNKK
jgi:uncharacterized protein